MSKVSKSRYRPRDYCDQPDAFGYSPHLRFAPLALPGANRLTPNERRRHLDNEAFAVAAQWQHEHALVIRRILHRQGMTLPVYASLFGESEKRISAVLLGENVMRIDDAERADRVLGSVHLLVLRNKHRRKLQETQAAINEIESGSQPW